VSRVSVALQRRSGTFRPPTLQTLPAAVTANVVEIRARTRSTIMAVVKADGYGHGAVTVARGAAAAGAGWLGTTSVAEASALRAEGLAVPILTWLHRSGIDAEAAAATRVDVAIGSVDELGARSSRTPCRRCGFISMWTPGCPAPAAPPGSGMSSSVSLSMVNRPGGSAPWVSWGIRRWPTGPTTGS
jgi:hypothetical protein